MEVCRKSTEKYYASHVELDKYVTSNTKKEVDEVNQAVARLQKKMDALSRTEEYKKLAKAREENAKEMYKQLAGAGKVFKAEVDKIMADPATGNKEKLEKVQRLYKEITRKIYPEGMRGGEVLFIMSE